MKRQLALLLAIVGMVLAIGLAYMNKSPDRVTRVFSPYVLLSSSWIAYKEQFINADGRVIDASQNDMTTSEGQSYAMLRAVWADDKAAFDQVWNWTNDNLDRPEDELFGWNWGKLPDGSYGFLSSGGNNSASDADSDIALALIFASQKWGDSSYADAAKPILADIWQYETAEVQGKRYLLAGRWAQSGTEIVLNPSYFAPYAWRIFSQFDTERPWLDLIDPAYAVLRESGQLELANGAGVGLPPNWITLDKNAGNLRQPTQELNTNYSFDAMRVPWRIAVDYLWFQEPQALEYLRSLSKLSAMYQQNGMLTGEYSHDGTPITSYESPAMYATALAYFKVIEPERAQQLYNQKIATLYSTDDYSFNSSLNYYDQNWLWFSVALYHDLLPNLYEGEPT